MLIKRENSKNWYCKFSIDGRTIYKTTGTDDKEKAEEVAVRLHAELFNQAKLGTKPRYLWQDAVVKFLTESQQKKSIETEKFHLRWLSPHLDGLYLDQIGNDVIENLITEKLKTTGTTRANRMTGVVSAILNKAYKQWKWIDSTPYIRKFKENNQRLRWLTHEEAERLIAELPEHSSAMARFALATGLRETNVTLLEWSQINMQTRLLVVHGDQSKNGKLIRVPLNDDAIEVLREQIGKHSIRVFTYKGQPVEHVTTKSFRAALKRAGIKDADFHALRHTWASWHVQSGTPLHVLQELGGWSSYSMVQRYAHLAPEHLAEYAGNVKISKKLADNIVEIKTGK